MRAIARFNLEFDVRTPEGRKVELKVPVGAEIATCRVEQTSPFDEILALYFIIETAGERETRKFQLVIGNEILPGDFVRYVGTFKFRNGIEVLHIIEI